MGALFDLSFNKFVSPTIAKIVYVVGGVLIFIAYILFTVVAFDASTSLGVFILLIGGPIAALFYLCILRVGLESLMAMILTARNTAELVRLGGGNAPGGPQYHAAPPYGPPSGSHPAPGSYPPPYGQAPPAGFGPNPPAPGNPPTA